MFYDMHMYDRYMVPGTWYQVLPNHLPAQFMQYTVFLYFAVVPGTMVLLLIYLYVVGPSYETPEHINIPILNNCAYYSRLDDSFPPHFVFYPVPVDYR